MASYTTIFRVWLRLGRAWLGVILLLTGIETATAQPRRVLLLHSFGTHFQPWGTIASRFREELIKQSPYGIDLHEASLQSARFGRSPDEGPFRDYISALFRENGLDLVVTLGAPATRFFQRHRAELFPSTPLLIMATDERTFSDAQLTANDAAVPIRIEEAKQIESFLQILPATINIAVAIGDSSLEKFWVEELHRSFQPFAGRVTFEWWNDLSLEDMVKHASMLPPRSAIYYASVRVDAHGVPQEDDRALPRIHSAANAPIFSYVDSSFGQGIVGGPLLSTEQIARQSASAAVRILSGESPGRIKTPTLGLSAPMYDWRELQRWNINEAVLPMGSEIYFRDLTAWERYRAQILGAFAALLVQGALISWLLYERRRRYVAEAATRETISELSHVNLMATAGELSASIAHEVNQPLAGIVSNANAAIRWLAAATPDVGRAVAALKQIVAAGHHASEVVASVRALFKRGTEERVPVQINELIRNAISLERRDIESHHMSLRLELNESLPEILGVRVQLLQVILNLIRNAIEAMDSDRARTLHIKSELDKSGDVLVSVEDSGIGIDEQNVDRIFEPLFSTKAQGLGIGLSICRSIIEIHNGRLWVTSKIGRGSTFFIWLPRYTATDAWQQVEKKP